MTAVDTLTMKAVLQDDLERGSNMHAFLHYFVKSFEIFWH